MRRTPWLVTLPLVAVLLAACGGSSKPAKPAQTTRSNSSPATASNSSATASPTAAVGSSAVTTAGLHASLSAPNHAPIVNKGWSFELAVMNASGRPLSGTVTVQFVFAGQVVGRDTPPTHPFKHGHWTEVLKFPPRALGIPLTFETVVHTQLGTVTLGWPVKVIK